MKRLLSIISVFALTASMVAANAQEQKEEFRPHWFMQVQGGVAHTVGETSFGDLLSPAAAIYGGYNFNPVFGLRVGLSGWQGKGFVASTTDVAQNQFGYKWNYVQGNIDAMFDLCNIFAGFRANRLFNPYLFAGFGGNYSFNQDDMVKNNVNRFEDPDFVWTDSKFFPAGRVGAGVDIRLSRVVYFNVEANTNILPNKFNSKTSNNVDWQSNLLVGFTFKFGGNSKKVAAPAVVPVDHSAEDAAKAAAAKEAAAKEAAAKAAKEAADAEAAAKAAAKDVKFEPISDNIFFTIGKYNIRESEQAKIDALAAKMKENAPTKVVISGYADKDTGTSKRNMFLSEKRSQVVKEAFIKAGIPEENIETKFYGSDVNPFQTPSENRVAVCVVYAK